MPVVGMDGKPIPEGANSVVSGGGGGGAAVCRPPTDEERAEALAHQISAGLMELRRLCITNKEAVKYCKPADADGSRYAIQMQVDRWLRQAEIIKREIAIVMPGI